MSHEAIWKDRIRSILPWPLYWRLKRWREEFRAIGITGDLTALAKIYKTDKWGYHYYTPVYAFWFQALRHHPVRLLEIGVGGYDKPRHGGDSLRMWKRYFYKGRIIGLDLYDKSALQEQRLKIYQGDQTDTTLLEKISDQEGPFDIIIDDGSHVQSHILSSFETLFPRMASGGIYVIEDTQTAYWPKFEGSTEAMDDIRSVINYFKERIHGINREEWLKDTPVPEIPDQQISAVSFYHNLIFIVKK